MLTHALAWIVGLGSLSLYGIALIFPELHRPEDRIWGESDCSMRSCSGSMAIAPMLVYSWGHSASVASWGGWERKPSSNARPSVPLMWIAQTRVPCAVVSAPL